MHETHVLVLVPQTVNGKPLTLKNLGELVQKPLNGGHATKYSLFNLGEFVDQPAKSHWALLTRTVIEGSRNKLYKDGKAVLAQYSQKTNIVYEIPTVLDAVVCNFMEYVRSGTWLYGDNPLTYTWCQEKYNASYYLVVGGGSGSGLRVSISYGACRILRRWGCQEVLGALELEPLGWILALGTLVLADEADAGGLVFSQRKIFAIFTSKANILLK